MDGLVVKAMDRISGLPDELLVKILSFVPTKVSVSTSVLSKRWEFLWMWVSKLDFVTKNHFGPDLPLRDFINKNLPLLRAPSIESFRLQCFYKTFQPEVINQWVAITLSRCLRELDISQCSLSHTDNLAVLMLPSSLYTCESLVSLKLDGDKILVDVPPTVSLPSLKTLVLERVTYLNEDCLQLLLSSCPVLEDLFINSREEEAQFKFHDGIFFNQLQHLKLCISFDFWSKLLFWLLQDSPRLRVLKLYVEYDRRFTIYKPLTWNSHQISVPECLLESLETFEFAGYSGRPEERDFVSYIIKNARRLKSSSITPPAFTTAET